MGGQAIAQRRFIDPARAVTHFHLRLGDVVADFGAGAGYFVPALVQAVAPEGRVYACEVRKPLVDTLTRLARERGLAGLVPLWCDIESPHGVPLADDVLDAGVLVNTLHSLESPALALEEISRLIRSGGKLLLIDWRESFRGIGPQPEMVMTEDSATAHVETAGFVRERTFDVGEHHYGVAFRQP